MEIPKIHKNIATFAWVNIFHFMHPKTSTTTKLELLITSGGDERIRINPETGLNKYLMSPMKFEGLLCRSSCTCNTLNEQTLQAVESTYNWYQNVGFDKVQSNQIDRLYSLLSKDYHNEFDIFIAPSGSDLAYLPLLIANILYPGQKIKSFITCPEELGSGSIHAMSGHYFYNTDQYGIEREKGGEIFYDLDIETFKFPARDKDGEIINHHSKILSQVAQHRQHARLGHLVVGSKSGIEDNLDIIRDCEEEMLWTVDLCQLRNSSKLIHKLLDWNAMIMITGSKFYQSPPFCGLMLVPKSISRRVAQFRGELDLGFHHIFSRYNFPLSWSYLRSKFKPFENLGLLLRWEAAIVEMEEFDKIPIHKSMGMVNKWHDTIQAEIKKLENLVLMPQQDHTNNSIISFRIRNGADGFLDYDQLKGIYDRCMLNKHEQLDGNYDRFSIGQPVRYSNSKEAFLRLALGSYDMRKLLDHPDFSNDYKILEIISEYGKEWASK
jgi:hypothetical protein